MVDIGRVGVWSRELRDPARDAGARIAAAQELDALGYGAIWMSGRSGREFHQIAVSYLEATSRLAVASGILSIWTESPVDVAGSTRSLMTGFPGRYLLGLGVSHANTVERQTGERYEKPLGHMRAYLDRLLTLPDAPPRDGVVLAALGPKMLELSAERTAGAHPYFVPVEHTRQARQVLGDTAFLAPEQAVVLETDAGRAREIARRHTSFYLGAPNYVNNLRRLGWTDAEFADGGSDRLVDALVAWGEPAAIRRRLDEHFAAGANHVCIQVLPADPESLPVEEWRAIAGGLGGLL